MTHSSAATTPLTSGPAKSQAEVRDGSAPETAASTPAAPLAAEAGSGSSSGSHPATDAATTSTVAAAPKANGVGHKEPTVILELSPATDAAATARSDAAAAADASAGGAGAVAPASNVSALSAALRAVAEEAARAHCEQIVEAAGVWLTGVAERLAAAVTAAAAEHIKKMVGRVAVRLVGWSLKRRGKGGGKGLRGGS